MSPKVKKEKKLPFSYFLEALTGLSTLQIEGGKKSVSYLKNGQITLNIMHFVLEFKKKKRKSYTI